MFLLLCPMSFGADKLGLAVTDFGHNPKRSRSSEQDGMACKFKVNECLIAEKIEPSGIFFTQINRSEKRTKRSLTLGVALYEMWMDGPHIR